MYGRRRAPIARTALLVGVTGAAARNAAQKQSLEAENAQMNAYIRQQEAERQIQMQAAATEDAVRRGVISAEAEKQQQGRQNYASEQQDIPCERCKQVNQKSSSFCSNCGLKLK
jgi:hypothetical protein